MNQKLWDIELRICSCKNIPIDFLKDRKSASAVGKMESLDKQLVFLADDFSDDQKNNSQGTNWKASRQIRKTFIYSHEKNLIGDGQAEQEKNR